MKSRVHPKYKTKYRVSNWAQYDRSLVQRGDITLWISTDATDAWKPSPSGRRGGQRKFSDHAIETALTLRLVFKLPLRQAEGFLTTLSRRGQHLDVKLRRVPTGAAAHLIVDSTGLSMVGEGEWAAAKHGAKGKRGWKKLHLGVDGTGIIVAQVLTDDNADDAATIPSLLGQTDGELSDFVADAAYDSRRVYDAATARGAMVVIPPPRSDDDSGRRSPATTAKARSRTPSLGTSPSSGIGSVLVTRKRRKPKRCSLATS